MVKRRRKGPWSSPGPVYVVPARRRLLITAFFIWWAAVVLVTALEARSPADLWQVACLTGTVVAVVAPRARAAVVATPLGLRVRNRWRERRLPWSQVAGFRAGPAGGTVEAVLCDGAAVPLVAASPGRFGRQRRQRARAAARRLGDYRQQVLGEPPGL